SRSTFDIRHSMFDIFVQRTTQEISNVEHRMSNIEVQERSGPPGSRTLISALQERRLPVGRAAQKVASEGIEPPSPGCGPGIVAAGPRGRHCSRMDSNH